MNEPVHVSDANFEKDSITIDNPCNRRFLGAVVQPMQDGRSGSGQTGK